MVLIVHVVVPRVRHVGVVGVSELLSLLLLLLEMLLTTAVVMLSIIITDPKAGWQVSLRHRNWGICKENENKSTIGVNAGVILNCLTTLVLGRRATI